MIFEFSFIFCFNAHGVAPYLIALRFDLAAPTRRVAVYFFTYNMLVKRHSDLIALGFLTGIDVMGDMGLLLVNPPGVENIAASRISLKYCWSSHLPECL